MLVLVLVNCNSSGGRQASGALLSLKCPALVGNCVKTPSIEGWGGGDPDDLIRAPLLKIL